MLHTSIGLFAVPQDQPIHKCNELRRCLIVEHYIVIRQHQSRRLKLTYNERRETIIAYALHSLHGETEADGAACEQSILFIAAHQRIAALDHRPATRRCNRRVQLQRIADLKQRPFAAEMFACNDIAARLSAVVHVNASNSARIRRRANTYFRPQRFPSIDAVLKHNRPCVVALWFSDVCCPVVFGISSKHCLGQRLTTSLTEER